MLIRKIGRKSSCETTVLNSLPFTSPCSLMLSDLLPSSRRELSLSRIEGLQRLAFSKTTQFPWAIPFISTESTHSNLLYPFIIELFNCWRRLAHYILLSDNHSLFRSKKPSKTLSYSLRDFAFLTPCSSSSISAGFMSLNIVWSSLWIKDKSCEVYSKQPRSWVVSLLSFSKIRFNFLPDRLDRVCKSLTKRWQSSLTTSKGKLVCKLSTKNYRLHVCRPYSFKISCKNISPLEISNFPLPIIVGL